jgi:MFS family permease
MAVHDAPADSVVSPGRIQLTAGTLAAAAFGVWVVQITMSIPAVLNGLFQQDLGTTSAQLTWITAAFLLPVTLLELTFGVLGDLFGRKKLLVYGSLLMAIGLLVAVLTPGPGTATGTRVLVMWTGQIICGIGAAAVLPTTLAMVAAGTHTGQARSRGLAVWSVALISGGFVAPVLGGWLAGHAFGGDSHGGWRWAFIVCLVLSLISAGLALGLARDSRAPQGRSLDWPGQITIALALLALLYAVIQAPTVGWGNPVILAGFVLGAVFLAAFIVIELRTPAPLLKLELFTHRPFAVAAVTTVLGMFAFLGTGYSSSIRLSAIQGFTPLRTSVAFVLLNIMGLIFYPVISRALAGYNPRWVLGAGFGLIAAGDLWLATVPITARSIAPLAIPLGIAGVGFAFAVSSVTAVTVNTVPNRLAGMASGTSSMLRDLGFTLAPTVLGAVALSKAARDIQGTVAASPALQKALASFYSAPAHAPAAQRAALAQAVGAVRSGPLGANAVPAAVTGPHGKPIPFNPLQDVAFHALGSAYSLSYLIAGCCALAAAALTVVVLRGRAHETLLTKESLG